MKFTTNGKRLKEMINLCLLKGKYNQGLTSTKGQMGNCVKITSEPNAILVENGDASTYVRVSKRIREGQNDGSFHAFVNADTLSKYLVDEESAFVFSEGNVKVLTGNSVVEIPTIERHEYAHVIARFSSSMQKEFEDSSSFSATEKLVLETRVCLDLEDFVEAVDMAEKVGSSVYTINANSKNNTFTVSSDKMTESLTTSVSPIEAITRDAIVSFSLPVSKALQYSNDDQLVIFYDDEKPVVFCTNDVVIMRAPRMEA